MTLKIGNINYENITTNASWAIPQKYNSNNEQLIHLKYSGNSFRSTAPVKTVLNAVEIDWNGAVLPDGDIANATSKTINTTSDLLELVNEMQKEIYVLGAAVISLANKY